ncbi:helix-turn-helix domain-containing protein [Herbaspirillum autotrophicum]|uniref:helix-turn-helix domain-containing protein n=1 Tax=Herbaspirillum autotrophicum TaxID=180195 RepID=UPI00067CF67E|nr:helix-turn-helix domain-containing protein [Herbaspirillum autotrophicum]
MSDQQMNELPSQELPSAVVESAPVVLPGAQLAALRQARGWSVEQVASQLKLATRQVNAIEADNYEALPGAVIIRGFIRAYAKLLGVDSGALMASFPKDSAAESVPAPQQRVLSTPFSESPLPLGNRSKISPAVAGGIFVAIVAAAVVVAVQRTDLLADVPQLAWLKPAATAPVSTEEVPEQLAEASGEPEKNRLDKVDGAIINASTAAVSNLPEHMDPPVVAAKPAAPAVAAVAPKPVEPVASVAAASDGLTISKSKDLLHLKFREDSWVEIRRADKTTMISRLLKAGTAESFDITEPVMLVVGNASGVDATLRGATLDLKGDTNSNVARLSLK